MQSGKVSTSVDIVLDHAFGDNIFDLLVSVLGEWDIAIVLREKGLNLGVILENPPRGHHEWPLVRFVCGNAPAEVDLGKFNGPPVMSQLSPELFLPSL